MTTSHIAYISRKWLSLGLLAAAALLWVASSKADVYYGCDDCHLESNENWTNISASGEVLIFIRAIINPARITPWQQGELFTVCSSSGMCALFVYNHGHWYQTGPSFPESDLSAPPLPAGGVGYIGSPGTGGLPGPGTGSCVASCGGLGSPTYWEEWEVCTAGGCYRVWIYRWT